MATATATATSTMTTTMPTTTTRTMATTTTTTLANILIPTSTRMSSPDIPQLPFTAAANAALAATTPQTTASTALSTAAATAAAETPIATKATLVFHDWTDLQTRLVLLPRVEEEGIGAVVASYQENESDSNDAQLGSDAASCAFDVDIDEDSNKNQRNHLQSLSFEGWILHNIHSATNNNSGSDWNDDSSDDPWCWRADFSDLLAAMRQAPTPVQLDFVAPCVVAVAHHYHHHDNHQSERFAASTTATTAVDRGNGNKTVEPSGNLNDDCIDRKDKDDDDDDDEKKMEYDASPCTVATPKHSSSEKTQHSVTNANATTSTLATSSAAAGVSLSSWTTNLTDSNNYSSSNSKWTDWTLRMREKTTLPQWATDAAMKTASLAQAAKERAAATAATVVGNSSTNVTNTPAIDAGKSPSAQTRASTTPRLRLFIQSSLGACLPIAQVGDDATSTTTINSSGMLSPLSSSSGNSAERILTNTSLVLVRSSATEPCPTQGYAFQWYRSSRPSATGGMSDNNSSNIQSKQQKKTHRSRTSSHDSGASSSSSSCSASTIHMDTNPNESSSDNQQDENGDHASFKHHHAATTNWMLLEGATFAAFQPTAMEAGHRLRCVISKVRVNDSDSDNAEDSLDDPGYGAGHDDDTFDHDALHRHRTSPRDGTVIVCETIDVVRAALPLWNGAKQALTRGAKFGGLEGLGAATGRTLLIQIVVPPASGTTNSNMNTSAAAALTIFQVSGNTSEALHPEQDARTLIAWSARADYAHPKRLELMLAVALSSTPSRSTTMALPDPSINGNSNTRIIPDSWLIHALAPDGVLRLQAPNRLARESLLLTLGIANTGSRAFVALDESTSLFPDTVHVLSNVAPATHSNFHEQDDNELPPTVASLQQTTEMKISTSSDAVDNDEISRDSAINSCDSTENPMNELESAVAGRHLEPQLHRPPTKATSESPPSLLATPTTASTSKRSASLDSSVRLSSSSVQGDEDNINNARLVQDLQHEMQELRAKLKRKDKIISELQRHVAQSDAALRQTEHAAKSHKDQIEQSHGELTQVQTELQRAKKRINILQDTAQRKQKDNVGTMAQKDQQLQSQQERIVELEKLTRTMQNEKAVLAAAVEARESKLHKMVELQSMLVQAKAELSQQDLLQQKIEEGNRRYESIQVELVKKNEAEEQHRAELDHCKAQMTQLTERLEKEQARTSSYKVELETQQIKLQKLKAERNSYKQKGDSLPKEMSLVCRHGRTIRDVERILADDAARRQEVALLREQKRKALEDLQFYRHAYEQSRAAQKMAGIDQEASRILERNAELERLLSELTEYVNAKEMQLQTMKQVNDALQVEIKDLAKATMSKNEV